MSQGTNKKTTWNHAAKQTRLGYQVFGKGFWGDSNRNDSDPNQYHKARAKLIFGNLLTLGLYNVKLMVGVKRYNERLDYWNKHLNTKAHTFAMLAKHELGLDEGEFVKYLKYKVVGGTKPDVTPSKNQPFARGWDRFVQAHRDDLEEAGLQWWE